MISILKRCWVTMGFVSLNLVPAMCAQEPTSRGVLPLSEELGAKIALVIGIDAYPDNPLNGAVADAKAVATRFGDLGFRVTLLLNRQATLGRLRTELETHMTAVDPEDQVVVYFAGHGATETTVKGGKRGYLCPVDYRPDQLSRTAYSMDALIETGKRIPARQVLYIFDCCYSGLSLSGAPDRPVRNEDGKAVYIITAGQENEVAMELPLGHGLFTYHLLTGLAGAADTNPPDERVEARELGEYLVQKVTYWSNDRQHPRHGFLTGSGSIVFPLQAQDAARLKRHLEALAAIEGQSPLESSPKGSVLLRATGTGFPRPGETNPTKKKLMARAAARLQALNELRQAIAVRLQGETVSHNMNYSNETIRTQTDGLIHGAVVEKEYPGPDGSYIVEMVVALPDRPPL